MTGNFYITATTACRYFLAVFSLFVLLMAVAVLPSVASAEKALVQIAPAPDTSALRSGAAKQMIQTGQSMPQPSPAPAPERDTVDLDSALHGLSVSPSSGANSSSSSSSSSSETSSEASSPVGLFFALPSRQNRPTAVDKKHGFLWHVLDNVGVPMFNNHDADLAPELRDRGAMSFGGLPPTNRDEPAGKNGSSSALFRQAVADDQAPLIDK